MKLFNIATSSLFTFALVTCCLVSQVSAQLPDNIRGQAQGAAQAAAQSQLQARLQQQVQAQVQARAQAQLQAQLQVQLQAQIQQEVQARMQTQVGAQAQSRLHADMARAATLAHSSIQSGNAELAATSRSAIDLSARARGQATTATEAALENSAALGQRTRAIGANSTTQAAAHGKAAVQLIADLPTGVTEADVQLYDNIFGRFNPLIENASLSANANSSTQTNASAGSLQIGSNTQVEATAGANGGQRSSEAEGATTGQQASHSSQMQASNGTRVDFSTRVKAAINQRRSEISLMRDEAMESADQRKMQAAEQMEYVLDTFIKAQAHARSAAAERAKSQADSDREARLNSSTSGSIK